MAEQLRVLLVEDSEDDAALLLRELKRAGYDVAHDRVYTADGIEQSLTTHDWDLVISDHGMPAFSGTEALQIVRRLAPDLPFIFVSGSIGEDIAVAAMRAGAQDYVMKGNIRRLAPAIGRELRDSEARRRERLTEEQLRSTGEMLRSVFSASPLAIIATDVNGLVKLWNPAAERLFGWGRDEVIGKENPVVPPDARETIEARRELAKQGETVTDLEARRVRKDGSLVDVTVTVAATRDRDGKPDGITVVYQDLTERKQLQAQFLQAQKMEAVGRLAGGVAHDFNNLLTVITSYAELLRADAKSDDPRDDDLAQIQRAADAATALTRQLLSFSRQRVIEPRVVELNEVVSGATKLASRLVGSTVEMISDLSPSTGSVKADPGHIEQIVMNLAVNARDAMPRGGKLRFTTRHVKASELNIDGAAAANGYAMVSVSDTGTGMDEATQQRMFEPFFTTKPLDKGTGLGLATVYGLVKQYEGTVRVKSKLGEGTTFEIYLPSASEAADAMPAAKTGAASSASAGTVLIVEDEPAVRAVARRVLERVGYAVIEAPDGQTAMRIAETRGGPINLLLTDVVMPGLGGMKLAAAFVSKRPATKVMFVSGHGIEADEMAEVRASKHAYLKKPFAPDELVRGVEAALK
ncbi:MAG TPA: response regulator [Gemmatimonadaceae bacterium]|nr:response regulator [Gemmatimonadaceae bacterium]